MDALKPIPIPLKQRWNDFRVAYLPVFTFVTLVAAICWMWSRYVEPPTIVGEVESVRASILSITAGTLQEVSVDRLQTVTNGQPLAVLALLDPDQLNSELAAAEADLRLMKARMDLDRTRNLDAYSRQRESLLAEQLNLELARIRLIQAESEFERTKKLAGDQIIAQGVSATRNDFGFDVALRDRNAATAELAARQKTVAELEAGVQRLETSGAAQVEPVDPVIEQAIKAQREHIQRLQKPVVLRSPLDGFVSDVNHHAGELVPAGSPIMVISASTSDRVYAWVRQPVTRKPQIGDVIEVRRVSMGEIAFEARVVKVGDQLERINPSLLLPGRNPERTEVGLPLLVQAEDVRKLIPGEVVQLRISKEVQP